MADPTTPPLPQTTAYSDTPAQQSWNMSVLDMPQNTGALDGQTRANALALAMQGQNAKIAPMIQATTGPNALPAWNLNDPSILGHDIVAPTDPNARSAGTTPSRTASGFTSVDPNAGSWVQGNQQQQAQGEFNTRYNTILDKTTPNTLDAISNWWSGGGGSQQGKDYAGRSYASGVLARPEAKQYLSAHPSLLAAAEADPVNFATKLGPILDAATARAQGKISTGQIVHNTIDGPVIKPDDHPEMTMALAKAHGITPQQAHAGSQSQHYTEDEFVNAMRGASRGSMRSMWEMQHYLDPTNQAKALALGIGSQRAQAGGPGSDAAGEFYRYLQTLGLGPQIYSQPPRVD